MQEVHGTNGEVAGVTSAEENGEPGEGRTATNPNSRIREELGLGSGPGPGSDRAGTKRDTKLLTEMDMVELLPQPSENVRKKQSKSKKRRSRHTARPVTDHRPTDGETHTVPIHRQPSTLNILDCAASRFWMLSINWKLVAAHSVSYVCMA